MTIALVHDASKLSPETAMELVSFCADRLDVAEDEGTAKFAMTALNYFWKRGADPQIKEAAASVLLNHLADLYLEDV